MVPNIVRKGGAVGGGDGPARADALAGVFNAGMDKLLELVGAGSREEFARDYAAALEEALDRGGLRREPHWTEAIAVGSREYVAAIDDQIRGRMRTTQSETQGGAWTVREPDAPYGQISGTKIERKRGVWVLNWA